MRRLREVEYVNHYRTISSTSATPLICECSDGCHYYTKFYEGNEGPRELVNEFIGFELAKLLNLPIPNAALVKINNDFEAYIGGEMKIISSSHKYAFGSKEIASATATLSDKFIRECQNKQDLLPIIVFDHLVGNSDREYNLGNILYRYKDKIIFIIDHGRIFDVGTLWDQYTCRQRKNEEIILKDFTPNSLYGKIMDNVDLTVYKDECIQRFSKIRKEDIINVFNSIPSEWECNDIDKNEGIEFMWIRFQKYEYILNKILNVKR